MIWFGAWCTFYTDIRCAAVCPKAKRYFHPNPNVSCTQNKCVKFSYLLFCLVKVVTISENNSFKKLYVPKTSCRCRCKKTYKFFENLLASDANHLATKYYGLPRSSGGNKGTNPTTETHTHLFVFFSISLSIENIDPFRRWMWTTRRTWHFLIHPLIVGVGSNEHVV